MRKLKLVMVGNGMAGVRTLEELRKIAPDMYEITAGFQRRGGLVLHRLQCRALSCGSCRPACWP